MTITVPFKLLLTSFLVLAGQVAARVTGVTPSDEADNANNHHPSVSSLAKASRLHIERGYVNADVSELLYQDLLEVAVPGTHDTIHDNLLAIHGEAGAKISFRDKMELVIKFRELVDEDLSSSITKESSTNQALESGVLRIQNLKEVDVDKSKELINNVVKNTVLEDGGTIHAYLSRPNSSALKNHTDVTDIFVLQVHGSKEWLLCTEGFDFQQESSSHHKLDSCATYDQIEMENLLCRKETLFPGDALFLPKRTVHSARATQDSLSAHLTFGLNDGTQRRARKDNDGLGRCENTEEDSNVPEFTRALQQTCNSAEGGTSCDSDCDYSCDYSCDSSCDYSCNCVCTCSCDLGFFSCDGCCNACCNNGCDSSCDSDCDAGCNSSCDVCPQDPTPRPTLPPTYQPTLSLVPSTSLSPSEHPTQAPTGSPSYKPTISLLPSTSQIPSESRTPSITPTAVCSDAPGWKDRFYDECSWYETYGCDGADRWARFGVSATFACCTCGGGCMDQANWTDSYGDSCDWYINRGVCTSSWAKNGQSSLDACCFCGGGVPFNE